MQRGGNDDLRKAKDHLAALRKIQKASFEAQFEQLKRFASIDDKNADDVKSKKPEYRGAYDHIHDHFQKQDREVTRLSKEEDERQEIREFVKKSGSLLEKNGYLLVLSHDDQWEGDCP
eukprot:jgi/Bigna1/138672/aug1.46_g13380